MPRHEKGTMVRIRSEEEQGEGQFDRNCTVDAIDEGGWIWIVQRFLHGHHRDNEYGFDSYECRSVATGDIIQLFPEEITTKPMKELNHVTQTQD